jgi:hypothetical protein
MGGSISKNMTRTEITNVINTKITQDTTNISTVVNKTITDVTTNIINNNKSVAAANIAGANKISLTNITITGDGTQIDLSQTDVERAIYSACQQLMNNASDSTNLANTINSSVKSQLNQGSAVEDSIKTLAIMQKATQEQGGITGVINKIFDNLDSIVGKITGAKTDTETTTIIATTIGVDVTNIITNEQNITNIISNKITTNITNNNESTCAMTISKTNQIDMANITIAGKNTIISAKQSISLDTTIACIQSNVNSAAMEIALTSAATGLAEASLEQIAKAKNNVSAEASTSIIKTLVPDSCPVGCPCGSMNICGMSCCTLLIILLVCMLFPSIIGLIWKFWPKGEGEGESY